MKMYLENFVKYKDLLFELVVKDITLKYRNSILGVFWSMLNPLLMMIVLSIVFMALFRSEIPNFPVYVLIGRILYQFFSESTSFAMDSIHSNAQLINKVYVPKYFFPLSRILSSFIMMLISFIPVILVMIFLGIPFRFVNLLVFIPLFYLLGICTGIGLLLAAFTVFFKDMKHFYSIILMVMMYMTPIFYPVSIIPERFLPIILLNPLYPIVEMLREVLLYGGMFQMHLHIISIVYTIFYVLFGVIIFYKTQDRFVYHL